MARNYDDQTRAAVMAALLAGQSVSSVAKEYKIPKGTVHGWKRDLPGVATQKEIGGLVMDYLRASLIMLRKQVEVFADEEWVKSQPAAELATLHGVCADKGLRLLEALDRGADEPAAE